MGGACWPFCFLFIVLSELFWRRRKLKLARRSCAGAVVVVGACDVMAKGGERRDDDGSVESQSVDHGSHAVQHMALGALPAAIKTECCDELVATRFRPSRKELTRIAEGAIAKGVGVNEIREQTRLNQPLSRGP